MALDKLQKASITLHTRVGPWAQDVLPSPLNLDRTLTWRSIGFKNYSVTLSIARERVLTRIVDIETIAIID